MKTIELPFGHGKQTLHVEESRLQAVLAPAHGEKQSESQQAIVQAALENPVGTPRLCELVQGKAKIVVITSDHTRPVPSAVTMPLLLREIRKGNPDAHITLLVATGMHRPPQKPSCAPNTAMRLWTTRPSSFTRRRKWKT